MGGPFHAPDEAHFGGQVEALFARGAISLSLRDEALSGWRRLSWSSGHLGPTDRSICEEVSQSWFEIRSVLELFAKADWARRVEIGADQILLGKSVSLGSSLENYLCAVVARTSGTRFVEGEGWIWIDPANFSLRDRIVRRLFNAVSRFGESPLGTGRLWLFQASLPGSYSSTCKPKIREFFTALGNLEKLTGLPDEITLPLKRQALGMEAENHFELLVSYRDSLLSVKP